MLIKPRRASQLRVLGLEKKIGTCKLLWHQRRKRVESPTKEPVEVSLTKSTRIKSRGDFGSHVGARPLSVIAHSCVGPLSKPNKA